MMHVETRVSVAITGDLSGFSAELSLLVFVRASFERFLD